MGLSMTEPRKHIAVIGGGYWGKNLVRNFDALGVLKTVCDQNLATLHTTQSSYPDIGVTQDAGEVFADPAITGVAIATPAATHGEVVRRALNAGKDVYVEKPLCLSTKVGAELIALAAQRENVLMVGHLLWYHPIVLKMKELVTTGELGRLQYIYSNRLNLGKLRREENVLWSFAPHDVSVILGLVGEMPESVQAQGGNFLHERISDTTVSMLTFASGLRAHIFVSWLHPFKEQKLVLVGDRKMAVFNDTVEWKEKLHLYEHSIAWQENSPVATKGEAERVIVAQEEPLRAECQHFLDCIESRAQPRTDGAEGLRVLSVLHACQEALETNHPVTIGAPAKSAPTFFAHETSIVDAGAQVGAGTKIWHFSHVLSGSAVGANCNIGQNVVVGPNVTVGDGCKIQNNVSVEEGVTLESDVFCGPSMVFTNVNTPRANVSRKHQFARTVVKRGASIGANATVICGCCLGEWCFIGAGAVVTRDVEPHALMIGNPARRVGWMCECGERLGDELTCESCARRYIVKDDACTRELV